VMLNVNDDDGDLRHQLLVTFQVAIGDIRQQPIPNASSPVSETSSRWYGVMGLFRTSPHRHSTDALPGGVVSVGGSSGAEVWIGLSGSKQIHYCRSDIIGESARRGKLSPPSSL